MPRRQTTQPELVAPAGSWEAFLAGLEAGADAFYLGLQEWSARGRARNFSPGDLRRLVPLAHAEGRRVYVALNTLLREDEVPRVAETVWDLLCLGVDALILQDLGLWRVCREAFPEARLHASTQMSVHSSAGVRHLERSGFSRVVLARECTIAEIAAIRRETSASLEVFVHGALCFSLSGQCLASTLLLGRSANRGWCAQPCRWGYRSPGQERERHPLSTADLCLVGRVWDLARAGVDALKIEGRLRGPDYVHGVVRAYRKVLDAPESDREGALGAAREILAGTAARPFCEGYAVHPRPRDVLRHRDTPVLGERVGRVHRWKAGSLVLSCDTELRRGDRLRIPTGPRGESVSFTLRGFRKRKVPGGFRYETECGEQVSRGDPVFRVKTAAGEALEQRLARQGRRIAGEEGLPLELRVSFGPGSLRVSARCGPVEAQGTFAVPMFPAERHPLDYTTLRKRFERLGGTPYRLARLSIEGDIPAVVIPPSRLNEVRREILEALEAERAAEGGRRARRATACRGGGPQPSAGDKRLWIRVETARTLWAAAREPFHRLVVVMTKECLRARDRLVQELKGRGRVVWELPVWIAEGDLALYRGRLERLAAEGFREVCVTNPAHFDLVGDLPLVLHGGRELNALNGWSAAALRDLGCRSFVVSPETDRENLGRMAGRGWPIPPVVYTFGHLPAFLTRLDPGAAWPEGATMETVAGDRLFRSAVPKPLVRDPWTRVYLGKPLCWSHRMGELRGLGIRDFLFDLQGRPFGSREVRIILKKFQTERPLSDTMEAGY